MSASILSLSTNILASGLILFRIYQAGRQIPGANGLARRGMKYRRLLWIYLESGSIYPTVVVISVPLYFLSSPSWWLVVTVSSQIAGMMPTLMILAIILAGRSLSESTMIDPYCTDPNSYATSTCSGRNNCGNLGVGTESLSQLTIIESGSGFQVHATKESEGYNSNESISFHGV